MNNKKAHEPLIHLVKRADGNNKHAWIVRAIIFVVSLLACAFVSAALSGRGVGFFFKHFFAGIFSTSQTIWNLFHDTAIMLLIALAVTPCFKMKFWNIGGEGQILMGGLGCAVVISQIGSTSSTAVTILVSLLAAIAFGMVWAVIPAIFKAFWNTNETLLTLMLNYIAVSLVNYAVKKIAPSSTGSLYFNNGVTPAIGGNEFILNIVLAVVIMAALFIYLKYTKHGYELSVVGESENTAKYIGINTKKVIIRTLILSGAMCGLIGFLLVSVTNHSIIGDMMGGRGFTGVLISWLGHFNPFGIALCSFIYSFFLRGAIRVGTLAQFGTSFPAMLTSIFLFFVIASEFFINYKIKPSEKMAVALAPYVNKIKAVFSKKEKETEIPFEITGVSEDSSVAEETQEVAEAATADIVSAKEEN